MNDLVKKYQCPGCIYSGTGCYKPKIFGKGTECTNHIPGTSTPIIGTILLGLPKGFNRVGESKKVHIWMYDKFHEWPGYNNLNIPIWKYLDENNNTIVKLVLPRIPLFAIQIFRGNCMDKINCFEVDEDFLKTID